MGASHGGGGMPHSGYYASPVVFNSVVNFPIITKKLISRVRSLAGIEKGSGLRALAQAPPVLGCAQCGLGNGIIFIEIGDLPFQNPETLARFASQEIGGERLGHGGVGLGVFSRMAVSYGGDIPFRGYMRFAPLPEALVL